MRRRHEPTAGTAPGGFAAQMCGSPHSRISKRAEYVLMNVAAWIESVNWAAVILWIEFLVKVAAVGIVPERRQPSSSQAWLLLILVLPVVGVPLYFMLGSPYVRGRRHAIQAPTPPSAIAPQMPSPPFHSFTASSGLPPAPK